ncbi:MFS transporter [Paraburkholderia fungorum]|uniref:MFS transporter n=1 Tax=Paraburkholderia fungorum TaxID=134537 RepID=UPI0038BA2EA0
MEHTGVTLPSPHWRTYSLVLALGTFAVGTDAFVIAGVLPSIASTLNVSTASAGQLVTVFSLTYAIAAPILGALTSGWSRRMALVVALSVFVVGNAITAVAPNFALVLLSRVMAAAGAGLFTATASATAAAFAGPKNRGGAIARVMLGLTSSLILGAPLGTAISAWFDWRMTMWLVTALGVIAGAVIFGCLPNFREAGGSSLAERLSPLRNHRVLTDLLRTLVVFTGVYVPYTYISVVYAPLTHSQPQILGMLLLVFGVAGTVGNLLAGRLSDRLGPPPVIIGGSLGLAAVFLLVPLLRASLPLAVIAVALSGVFSFSLTTPQQHQLISRAPDGKLSLLTSLYQSVLYLAISLSGAFGAAVIKWGAADQLTVIATLPVVLATLIMWLQSRAQVKRASA